MTSATYGGVVQPLDLAIHETLPPSTPRWPVAAKAVEVVHTVRQEVKRYGLDDPNVDADVLTRVSDHRHILAVRAQVARENLLPAVSALVACAQQREVPAPPALLTFLEASGQSVPRVAVSADTVGREIGNVGAIAAFMRVPSYWVDQEELDYFSANVLSADAPPALPFDHFSIYLSTAEPLPRLGADDPVERDLRHKIDDWLRRSPKSPPALADLLREQTWIRGFETHKAYNREKQQDVIDYVLHVSMVGGLEPGQYTTFGVRVPPQSELRNWLTTIAAHTVGSKWWSINDRGGLGDGVSLGEGELPLADQVGLLKPQAPTHRLRGETEGEGVSPGRHQRSAHTRLHWVGPADGVDPLDRVWRLTQVPVRWVNPRNDPARESVRLLTRDGTPRGLLAEYEHGSYFKKNEEGEPYPIATDQAHALLNEQWAAAEARGARHRSHPAAFGQLPQGYRARHGGGPSAKRQAPDDPWRCTAPSVSLA